MTITAAELLSQGNTRTGKSETTIDYYIKAWVHALTMKGIEVEAENEITLIDDTPNYDISSYLYKKIKTVSIIDSSSNPRPPLTEISFYQYKVKLSQNHSKCEPKEYALFNNVLYLMPQPNATAYPTMKVAGPVMHADSTTISYPDRYRECGIEFICFKIWEKYGQANTFGKTHFDLFTNELNGLLAFESSRKKVVPRYSDI